MGRSSEGIGSPGAAGSPEGPSLGGSGCRQTGPGAGGGDRGCRACGGGHGSLWLRDAGCSWSLLSPQYGQKKLKYLPYNHQHEYFYLSECWTPITTPRTPFSAHCGISLPSHLMPFQTQKVTPNLSEEKTPQQPSWANPSWPVIQKGPRGAGTCPGSHTP